MSLGSIICCLLTWLFSIYKEVGIYERLLEQIVDCAMWSWVVVAGVEQELVAPERRGWDQAALRTSTWMP